VIEGGEDLAEVHGARSRLLAHARRRADHPAGGYATAG
jgi:hypothetical protein